MPEQNDTDSIVAAKVRRGVGLHALRRMRALIDERNREERRSRRIVALVALGVGLLLLVALVYYLLGVQRFELPLRGPG